MSLMMWVLTREIKGKETSVTGKCTYLASNKIKKTLTQHIKEVPILLILMIAVSSTEIDHSVSHAHKLNF